MTKCDTEPDEHVVFPQTNSTFSPAYGIWKAGHAYFAHFRKLMSERHGQLDNDLRGELGLGQWRGCDTFQTLKGFYAGRPVWRF
jgi:hypothetical protein